VPVLLAYVLSFVNIGIYWNNQMPAAVSHLSGVAWWANQHLLFWLSLIAAVTTWMSENHFPAIPVTAYGMVLAASLCYSILQTRCCASRPAAPLWPPRSARRQGEGLRLDVCLGIGLSFADRWLGIVVYVAVAVMWFIPDRRVERTLTGAH